MLRIGLLALLATSTVATAAEIPKGAHIGLRMVNSINTRTTQEGDYVYLRTATPLAADGQIVVPVDAYVQGVVSHAKRSGRVSGRAELSIRLETLTLPGGKVLKFSARLNSVDSNETEQRVNHEEDIIKQGGTRGQDAARIAILGAIRPTPSRSWDDLEISNMFG